MSLQRATKNELARLVVRSECNLAELPPHDDERVRQASRKTLAELRDTIVRLSTSGPGSVEKAPEPPVPLPKPKGRPKGSYKFGGPLVAKSVRLPPETWELTRALGGGSYAKGIRDAIAREALRRRLATEALRKIENQRPELAENRRDVLSWLVSCPSSDINFKSNLKRATAEELRDAIAARSKLGGSKAAIRLLESRLRRIERERAK